MTFCCNNIKKAYELINEVKKDIDRVKFNTTGIPFIYWSGEAFVDNVNNLVAIIKTNLNNATISINNCQCEAEKNFYKERQSELVDKLNNLSSSSTKGYNELLEKYKRLANNSVSKESVERTLKELEDKYNNLVRNTVSKEAFEELEQQWKQDVKDYNELLTKHQVLGEKCKNLIKKLEEYEDYKDKYDELRDETEKERISNTREKTKLQEKLESKSSEIIRVNKQLTDTTKEWKLTQKERDNLLLKLDQKNVIHNQKVEALTNQLSNLQIESNNKDNELREKNKEIERLKKRYGLSQEELLKEKSHLKEEKLKIFTNHLRIELERINNLLRYYERLIDARKNYNHANIETHEANIARMEEELNRDNVDIENIHKVFRKCEKLAEIRFKLNQIRQQQYQAQQEQPTN